MSRYFSQLIRQTGLEFGSVESSRSGEGTNSPAVSTTAPPVLEDRTDSQAVEVVDEVRGLTPPMASLSWNDAPPVVEELRESPPSETPPVSQGNLQTQWPSRAVSSKAAPKEGETSYSETSRKVSTSIEVSLPGESNTMEPAEAKERESSAAAVAEAPQSKVQPPATCLLERTLQWVAKGSKPESKPSEHRTGAMEGAKAPSFEGNAPEISQSVSQESAAKPRAASSRTADGLQPAVPDGAVAGEPRPASLETSVPHTQRRNQVAESHWTLQIGSIHLEVESPEPKPRSVVASARLSRSAPPSASAFRPRRYYLRNS